MKKKETYAVFGLGRYGMAVAKELVENGKEVLAVDINQRLVATAAAYLSMCKCADVTEAEEIVNLGIKNVDVVIVCMANHFEASVMAIALCKEAGVRTIIAKCANEVQKKVFLRIGADAIVFPEYESGVRLAKSLSESELAGVLSGAEIY